MLTNEVQTEVKQWGNVATQKFMRKKLMEGSCARKIKAHKRLAKLMREFFHTKEIKLKTHILQWIMSWFLWTV